MNAVAWARRLAALGCGVLLVSGCSALTLEQLPAPKQVSGPTYPITAQFSDVQDLTIGAKVKLQGVVIGEVTSISTRDFHANIGMNILQKFPLAKAATFQVRFTTPLGEDFIAVSSPDKPGQARLQPHDVVAEQQTSDAPSIEDTFAAVSLLLNGGGLDKLKTIADELDKALDGNTGNARDALIQLQKVVAGLDAHTGDIDKTLDGLKAMATTLNDGSSVVVQALNAFPQTLQLLASDTGKIRLLLGKVAKLGDSVNDLLSRGQQAMLDDFDQLRPTLDALVADEPNLLPTFNSLISFGKLLDQATPGDYLNLSITIRFLLNSTPQNPPLPAATTKAAPSSSESTIISLLTGGTK